MIGFFGTCAKKYSRTALMIVVTVILSGPAMAQVGDPFPPETWHQVYDSGYGNDVGYGIVLDNQQNVITVGYRVTSNSGESHNAYARKYDKLGNFLCEREAKGPQSASQVAFDDRFYGVAVDSQDNFIATGTISGNWYGAEGYHNAMYLNKYDADCNPVWAQPVIYHETGFGDSAWQEANSVVVDPSDNIFTAGRVFASWGPNQGDWATWKYDANGALQAGFPLYYNYSTSYLYADLAYDVAVDNFGNIIVVGVRGVSGCEGCITNNIDWHVRKYNSSGTLLWQDTYDTANLYDYAYRVAVDSQNNVIVVGYTNKGTDNSTNLNYDWLVIKYAADGVGGVGQRLWTKTYESAAGRSEAAQAVVVRGDDNVIVGGYVRDAAGNLSGRLALLNKDTGDDIGERLITDPAGVIPMRLAYRNGSIAIGGYVYDPSGINHNMYSALLSGTTAVIDNFDDNRKDKTLWGPDYVYHNGILKEQNKRLEYTVSTPSKNYEYTFRPLITSRGPYDADWRVQIDLFNGTQPTKDNQGNSFGISVIKCGNDNDEIYAELYALGGPSRKGLYAELRTEDASSGQAGVENLSSSEPLATSIQISFDSIGKIFTCSYGTGDVWEQFGSFGVSNADGGTNGNGDWVMTDTDQFCIAVYGYSEHMSIASGKVYGDNFKAEGVTTPLTTRILKPTPEEPVPAGEPYIVVWEAPIDATKFKLQYSMDNGSTWKPMTSDFVTGDSYEWKVVPIPSKNKPKCLVKVDAYWVGYNGNDVKIGTDVSDAFMIEVASITAPIKDEIVPKGAGYPVTWVTHGISEKVSSAQVFYTLGGTGIWKKAAGTMVDPLSSFDWDVPSPSTSTKAKLKVVFKDASLNTVATALSGVFKIE